MTGVQTCALPISSIIIWLGNLTGAFQAVINLLTPVVNALGLPDNAAEAFLFGFFRRDYGAAGLYDLHEAGILSPRQLAVAAYTLTLFIPCVAQFSMMWKDRELKLPWLLLVLFFLSHLSQDLR